MAARHAGCRNAGASIPSTHRASPGRDPEQETSKQWDRPHKDPQPLCRTDLQEMTADIKRTFSAARADMKAEMRAITARLGAVEDRSVAVSEVTQEHALRLDAHTDILRDLYRRVEDLDNRGRRH